MTSLFHQFRTRSRGLIHGLALLLVASWLSLACPNCFASAEAGAPDLPCHQQSAVPAPSAGHDCCQQGDHGLPCDDPGCTEPVAITDTLKTSAHALDQLTAFLPAGDASSAIVQGHAPPWPLPSAAAVISHRPLYLRYCTFLN